MTKDAFLSYAKEDLHTARRVYGDLCNSGVNVWFDREDLKPGEHWKSAISRAIRGSSYFLALISQTSINKKGYVQREVKEALEVLSEVPEHDTFIIPIRVDDCMPTTRELLDLQFVDLFPSYEMGFQKLLAVLIPCRSPSGIQSQTMQTGDSPVIARFSQRFGDEARQLLHGLATDSERNIIIAGDFWGSVDFGQSKLTCMGDRDIFLAKFNRSGTHLWSRRYGDQSEQVGVDVGTDENGAIFVTSAFTGMLDFGGNPLRSNGRYNIALAKLDGNGKHVWSCCFGDNNYHVPECIAVAPSGTVVLCGRFRGSVDFGGGEIQSESEGTDIFVAAFSPDGDYLWAKRLGDGFDQQMRSVAIDADGNIALAGLFRGAIKFDGLSLVEERPTDFCGFIAKLDKRGSALWCKRFGDPYVEQGSAVAFDLNSGDLLAAGFIRNKLPHDLARKTGSVCLLGRYDAAGVLRWSKTFGTRTFPDSLSIASDGRILLTGHFEQTVNFGLGPLQSAGGYDVFAVMFTPDGNVRWCERFGDKWQQFLIRGVHGEGGSIVLAGSFHGTIDFGNGALIAAGYSGTNQGAEDVFLAILED